MNELRQMAGDLCKCIDEMLHANNILYCAIGDLKANLSFYTDGAGSGDGCDSGATESRGSEGRCVQEERRLDAGRVCNEDPAARDEEARPSEVEKPKGRTLTTAKPDHRLANSPKSMPLPDTRIARAALGEEQEITATLYYARFTEECAKAGCAGITQKGMRYLAYCCGYDKVRSWRGGVQRVCFVRVGNQPMTE